MLDKRISLSLSILAMEFRNILAYRFVFWSNFLGATLSRLAVAYFLWDSIFTSQGMSEIGGMSFKHMVFYYLLAPMMYKCTSGLQMRIMSTDIYEGGLNKYLLYPLSYFHFKLMTHFAHTIFFIFQMLLAVGVFALFFEIPPSINITLQNFFLMLPIVLISSYLYFVIAISLEQIAFWADNVWTLWVLLRWVIYLLGGSLIPLSLFPESMEVVLNWLPFSALISLPVKVFMGEISSSFYLKQLLILIFWCGLFTFISQKIWKRGVLQYSGVGI